MPLSSGGAAANAVLNADAYCKERGKRNQFHGAYDTGMGDPQHVGFALQFVESRGDARYDLASAFTASSTLAKLSRMYWPHRLIDMGARLGSGLP